MERELTKAKAENTELWTQLQEFQNDLQTLQRNYATLSGQVMSLWKQLKEAEEKFYTILEVEAVTRMVTVMKVKQKAVANFKESEEYKLATQDFDAGYDKELEEIFYNIWRKRRGVCYKFLGKEY